jgi:hypothetical protein
MTVRVPRLPFSLDPLMAEAKRRMRRRRAWRAASLILIAGIAAAAARMAASGGPGSTGGGPGVHGLLSQVQSSFGDSRLLSASINGRTLTVKVSAPDEPSAVSATFEAQMLAAAVHDSESASGQTPISSVKFVNSNGALVPGYTLVPVRSDTGLAPLAAAKCRSLAQTVQSSSLALQSALTLPYAGGACAFKFQTSSPPPFSAALFVGKLLDGMSDPSKRSYLVEVDNSAGVPLSLDDYTPGGGGVAYTKPRSPIPSVP